MLCDVFPRLSPEVTKNMNQMHFGCKQVTRTDQSVNATPETRGTPENCITTKSVVIPCPDPREFDQSQYQPAPSDL